MTLRTKPSKGARPAVPQPSAAIRQLVTQYSMEEVLDAYNSGGDTYTMSDGTTMSRYDVFMLVMALGWVL